MSNKKTLFSVSVIFLLIAGIFVFSAPTTPSTSGQIQYNALVCKRLLSPSEKCLWKLVATAMS